MIKSIVYPVIAGRDYAYTAPPLFIESDTKDAAINALREEEYRIKLKRGAHEVRRATRDEVLAARSAYADVQEKLHEIAAAMSDHDTITVRRVTVWPRI